MTTLSNGTTPLKLVFLVLIHCFTIVSVESFVVGWKPSSAIVPTTTTTTTTRTTNPKGWGSQTSQLYADIARVPPATGSPSFANGTDSNLQQLLPGIVVSSSAATTTTKDDEVNCARSISGEICSRVITSPSDDDAKANDFFESILSTYLGPRIILGLVAILYATNFSLGAIMDDALPASAATSSRMVLASIVLSPFLLQLKPSLRMTVLVGGCFVSLGYITQSIALVDTSPAVVSFLGSATVIVCPFLEWLVDKKPMSIRDAPQTWLAAILCMLGVGTLELYDPSGASTLSDTLSTVGTGDILSLIQAVGFGTGCYLSEKMMKQEPDQALPITSGLIGTTAFMSMLWCFFGDNWMFQDPNWESFTLPGLFMDPTMRTVALAVAWTGILSTSTNFFIEITALGRVPSAEASVILATEPLWASLFAALTFHETFGTNVYLGGLLMVSACLVNTIKPHQFTQFFSPVPSQESQPITTTTTTKN